MNGPNPFDQFADDFRAAIPAAPAPVPNAMTSAPPPTLVAPTKPSGPPMNAPPMANVNQGPPMYGGYGAPPGAPMYGGMGMGMGGPTSLGGPGMGGPPHLGGQQMGGPPPLNNGMGGGAIVPSAQQSNPYANMLPGGPGAMTQGQWGQAPPNAPNPQWQQMQLQPPPPQQQRALPQPPVPNFNMLGGGGAPPAPPMQQRAPNPMPPQQPTQPPQNDSFGGLFDPMTPAPPAPAPTTADPWGHTLPPNSGPPPPTSAPPSRNNSMAPPANEDPFGGIFGSPAPPPPPAAVPASNDPWGPSIPPQQVKQDYEDSSTVGGGTISDMRNAVPTKINPEADFFSSGPSTSAPVQPPVSSSGGEFRKSSPQQLPEGGEYFDARIFTPTLGVMFFKPQELKDSIFLQTDPEIVNSLEERPTVAFIVEGSSARSAGVELGNVLLKVNGIEVRNPKEASRLIKEGPRPLPLLFYVPDTPIVVAEGEHMVKYDTRETGAPLSAKDWKPKYCVIGGIIAQPWMMNMYRSKAEYDIAVIETQARRPVSVKVKQFSMQGARIQNDWQGPQMVKYKNKLHPWKFVVILPVSRNPIKISSSNLSQLKPVHEGIRRVLLAQQRGSNPGIQAPTAAPVRTHDPYGENGRERSSEGGVGSVRRKNPY